MPLKRCSKDGKTGWKFGDSGHCYTGPGAKKSAIKQGLAIEPDYFKNHANLDEITDEDIEEIISDTSFSPSDTLIILEASAKKKKKKKQSLYSPEYMAKALEYEKAAMKTFEVKYEKNGKTHTTSIQAKTSSDATRYVRSQHEDIKIIDVYEI